MENARNENAAQNCGKCDTSKMRETQNMSNQKYRNAAMLAYSCIYISLTSQVIVDSVGHISQCLPGVHLRKAEKCTKENVVLYKQSAILWSMLPHRKARVSFTHKRTSFIEG